MEGKQKLFYLPENQTDFIFAVISEELGLIGALAVLALFAVILWRGLRAAAGCSSNFGRLLAIGITVTLVGQALVNVSVVIGLLPTKGIPLPFVSYGGSSLLMNLLAVGVLLNISQARGLNGEVWRLGRLLCPMIGCEQSVVTRKSPPASPDVQQLCGFLACAESHNPEGYRLGGILLTRSGHQVVGGRVSEPGVSSLLQRVAEYGRRSST